MPQILERLKTALSGRYEVERELGSGGMATVYLARDVRHNRPVAIKVLNPALLASGSSRRFLTEVHITANLQHPNILPLHDSGELEDLVFYVMPFIEGESLRARLTRDGPLPYTEGIRILIEVADALACAHEHGVVHRDIKPENILLSRGHALVADFGVAKANDLPSDMATLTGEGYAVGTPAYMAPEQALGGQIGPRTDLYALGLLAFETLSGRHPFEAATPAALVGAQVTTRAPRLASRLKDCPPALDDLVSRLLAKQLDDRPANAGQVCLALQELGGGTVRAQSRALRVAIAVALVLGTALAWTRARDTAAPPPATVASHPVRSLAVLPLTRIGGDSTDDYFGDGIADELISALGRVPGLRVASRTSSFALKGQAADLKALAQRLDVQHVLEGSVQRSQGRVRVIVRLVDAGRDTQLWTGKYDGTTSDVFAMQDSVVRAITGALQFSLAGAATPAALARGTTDPMAHDRYLRGRHFLSRRTPESLALAVRHFREAIARDSTYSQAWAGLAMAWALSAPFAGARPHDVFPQARAAVQRSLVLDSTAADAHMARAHVAMFYDWDWKLAEAEFQQSIALNPNDAETRLFYSWYLVTQHRMREARTQIEAASSLDPLSVIVTARMGTMAWFEKRYGEAETWFRKALELDSTFHLARVELPTVLLALGRPGEARKALPDPHDLRPGTSESGWPAQVRVDLGDTAGARTMLDALLEMQQRQFVTPDVIGMVRLALGDADGAIKELERAVDEHAYTAIFLGTYPPFRRLHRDPRYLKVLARMGLTAGT